jgi:ribosomal small subunit protein bTHX
MGRGDIRTRKGKIFARSFGNRRKRAHRPRKTATARR